MSYLLSGTFYPTLHAFRAQSYRLLQRMPFAQSITDTLSQRMKTTGPLQWMKNGRRSYCTPSPAYDMNTNLAKDVVLFRYENPKFYKTLNLFAICQFIFWNYLSYFSFTSLRDAPVEHRPDEELKWYQRLNLGDNKFRNGITTMCFLIGYGILVASWMFTLRSVRFLILCKGGKDVAFVTYGPFNKNRIMTVPLKYVSAEESRQTARVQLPIKVKNRALYYVLDMRGEFRNPQLFDHTAGLRRRIVDK